MIHESGSSLTVILGNYMVPKYNASHFPTIPKVTCMGENGVQHIQTSTKIQCGNIKSNVRLIT